MLQEGPCEYSTIGSTMTHWNQYAARVTGWIIAASNATKWHSCLYAPVSIDSNSSGGLKCEHSSCRTAWRTRRLGTQGRDRSGQESPINADCPLALNAIHAESLGADGRRARRPTVEISMPEGDMRSAGDGRPRFRKPFNRKPRETPAWDMHCVGLRV